MKTIKLSLFLVLTLIVIVVAACSNSQDNASSQNMSNMNKGNTESPVNQNSKRTAEAKLPMTTSPRVMTGKTIILTAKEAVNQFDSKHKFTVWTFNGSVPGPTIKLKQGEKVTIKLKNDLPKPVTIHWHGLPLPNSQDGIPGVTQNAVQPGKTYTYQFVANVPGTYWYHSHQDSVNQVDKGLYGALIVEGKHESKVDKDYTLVLDDWISSGKTMDEMGNMSGMSGMNMSGNNKNNGSMSSNMGNMNMNSSNNSGMNMGDNMSMYDLYTINGKDGDSIQPLNVRKGDKVRIRLINAGYLTHSMHLHGHHFKVVSTDGNPINNPTALKDQLIRVAPGERYDIEFTADNPGNWYFESHDPVKAAQNMMAKIQYVGSNHSMDKRNDQSSLPFFDFTAYGEHKQGPFTFNQQYDVHYTMDLNSGMNNKGMIYTINGKTFPNTEAIHVKKGDSVKITLRNLSQSDHPMHLHGHTFQVLSKNGQQISGSPIMKDTINVKPGEEYVIAFKANNPGDWMFHCHDLHHAAAGMVTDVKYDGYTSPFKADPNAGNIPE